MSIDSPQIAAVPVATRFPPESRWVYRSAVAVVALLFVLIFAGAEVTSTNSGMAFRTWPDADGQYLWPEHPTLSQILEHSHRLLGVAVGLTTILLVVLVWLGDRREWPRWWAISLLGLVIVQGLLGGFRVLLDQQFPILFPILHGCLAHAVLAIAGYVVFIISPAWISRSIENGDQVRTLRRLARFTVIVLVVQVLFGVIVRHSNNGPALWSHVGFSLVAAIAVLAAVGYSSGRFNSVPGFARMNRIILTMLGGQMVLGLITLMVRRPKHLTDTVLMGKATTVSTHVVLGGALLMMTTVLLARSHRNLVPRVGA